MVQRVRFTSTAAAPLRISVAGVDVTTAEFGNLIFDANQPPLRLWGTGYGLIRGPTYNERTVGGKNLSAFALASGFSGPGGASPIFAMMQRGVEAGVSARHLQTPYMTFNFNTFFGGGCGIGASGGVVNIFNSNVTFIPSGTGNELSSESAVNFCVFKNY